MFRQSEPLEILGASPDDAPVCYLRINSDWAVLLIGLAEYLLSPWFWDENTGDVDAATTDAARLIEILGDCMADNVAIFAEQFPSGTHGGTSVALGYQYRVLNTVVVSQSWASLSGGMLQLQPGKYHIHARVAGHGVGPNRAIVHNSNSPVVYHRGDSAVARTYSGQNFGSWGGVDTVVDVPVADNFLLMHYTTNAVVTSGLGFPIVEGYPERYASVVVTRLPG